MGYSAAETAEKHQRILSESIRLFRERGFSGVSVGELMKAAGLTHGPFYNHFSSKESLMAESVEQEMQRFIETLDALPASASGKARYADAYLSEAHRDDPGTGCVMAALATEVRHAPEVRAPFTRQVKAFVDKLASRFPWSSKRAARGDAIRTVSSLVGALILARAVDDESFSQEILREVRKGIP